MREQALSEIAELDCRFHLHPFTDHVALHESGPHVLVRGEGVWVTEQSGRRLLDGLAGLWCVNVGYGCERIVEAVSEQLRALAFYPTFFQSVTEPAARLAERLVGIAPVGMSRVMFCGSGSEANESALKIIRFYQQLRGRPEKHKILARSYAYHGVTLAATSLTGLDACHAPFDLPLEGYVRVPGPYAYRAEGGQDPEVYGQWCIEETRRAIEREGAGTIAALFAEPIQGAGGVIVPPPGYLKQLRQLCREHDILFVADEVITGFGRLGDWFASNLWSLEPDLLTMAKGLTSGYLPMGATLLGEEIAERLVHGGSFTHGFTYSGHPTCAAAALANLDEIEQRGLLAHVRDWVGPQLEAGLRSFESHPAVAEVRACGLIGALELELPESRPGSRGAMACALAREEGVIVRGLADTLAVSPPLVITPDELDYLLQATGRALDRLLEVKA